ncbi:MAG: hypothetical protein P4L82_10005 [Ancalomicrobiaceae bacterium]|nr:hypothetical protein [Ancalomicrobiaceae bacterium]
MTDSRTKDSIANRLKEIEAQLEELQREANDLAIALRVLNQFERHPGPDTAAAVTVLDKAAKLGPARPKDIPSNFEMARLVLAEARKAGKKGLSASELIDAIGEQYWPGVKPAQISSFLYAFAKRGRLQKGKDGLFRLPKTNEAPADGDPQSASKPDAEWE